VCLCTFFLTENLYETENFEVKITLESNIALGVQQTLGLLEQQTSLRIAMEFLSLRPANISANRNVALHARNLGPPCSSVMQHCNFWKLKKNSYVIKIHN